MTLTDAPAVDEVVAPPPGNPRFPLLDALRALAACGVVVFHAGAFARAQDTPVGRVIAHLDIGVTIFFLLTGFLLYRPLLAAVTGLGRSQSCSAFYVRRLLRIVPAFWAALIVLRLAGTIGLAHPAGIPNFAFVQIYFDGWARTAIPPGWSVCVEMSFYLLLPAYVFGSARLWRAKSTEQRLRGELVVLGVLTLASIALRAAIQTDVNPYRVDLLPAIFAWFACGMLAAVVTLSPEPWAVRVVSSARDHQGRFWVAAGFLFMLTLFTNRGGVEGPLWLFVLYGLIALLVLAPAVAGGETRGVARTMLQARPLPWIGLVSYGIYLWHYPLMQSLSRHLHGGPTSDTAILSVFGLVAATAAGAASYYALERPVLRLKRRFN